MPSFGRRSRERLATCRPDLQRVLNRAIEVYDFTILDGHRTEERQREVFERGMSKVQWPNSKHNSLPSLAVDIAPWPIDWRDLNRFYFLAGVVHSAAADEGVTLRWGGDWDRDYKFDDQKFNDLPHFELAAD